MTWNWQLPNWPNFTYDEAQLTDLENDFVYATGHSFGVFSTVDEQEEMHLRIDLLSQEAMYSSVIEGDYLDRVSLQSSICKHFGLKQDTKSSRGEVGIAEMLLDSYQHFDVPLTHSMLYKWHCMLMQDTHVKPIGAYRMAEDAMQVVSGSIHKPKVHFEAPPACEVHGFMTDFICWFNRTALAGPNPLPALARAAIAHLYFECIHPFEDGNGRIGRVLAERVLAQSIGQPTLIALSTTINKRRKLYYDQLEMANKRLDVTEWVLYFAGVVLEALDYTKSKIEFLVKKSQLLQRVGADLNDRQLKVVNRLLREGPEGFEGGLSAKNYLSLTKTSRATATRDLADFVDMGVLRKTGELRYTRYFLSF